MFQIIFELYLVRILIKSSQRIKFSFSASVRSNFQLLFWNSTIEYLLFYADFNKDKIYLTLKPTGIWIHLAQILTIHAQMVPVQTKEGKIDKLLYVSKFLISLPNQ